MFTILLYCAGYSGCDNWCRGAGGTNAPTSVHKAVIHRLVLLLRLMEAERELRIYY